MVAAAFGYGGRLSALSFATLAGYFVLVHSLTLFAGLTRSLTLAGVAALLALALAAALVLAQRAGRAAERSVDEPGFTIAGIIASAAATIVGSAWAWPPAPASPSSATSDAQLLHQDRAVAVWRLGP